MAEHLHLIVKFQYAPEAFEAEKIITKKIITNFRIGI